MSKLIYIVGFGRSGSTVLDILIGSHNQVFPCGELINLIHSFSNGEYCACGKKVFDCRFWSKVVSRWILKQNLSEGDVRLFAKLDRLYGHPKSIRAWMTAFFPRITNQHRWYLKNLGVLLKEIKLASGETIITDSSKSPVRLLQIAHVWEGELIPIHLVKHPAGVIDSLSKTQKADLEKGVQKDLKSKSEIRTALLWTVINRLTECVVNRVREQGARIRYEDFVAEPQKTVKVILDDFDYHPPLATQHICAGNRLRMSKDGCINIKNHLRNQGLEKKSGFCRSIYGSTARRYGYK